MKSPRNQTLIFGSVATTLRPENNWNPLVAQAQHPDSNSYGLYEELFYTNLNTGELIPWQAESYTISDDYTGVTLKLRDGVTWCDGVQFTAEDVKYTLDLLATGDPGVLRLGQLQGIHQVRRGRRQADRSDHPDPAGAQVVQGRVHPRTRSVRDRPKHIFEKQADIKTFTFYDLEKGWPCTTGSVQDHLVDAGEARSRAPRQVVGRRHRLPAVAGSQARDLHPDQGPAGLRQPLPH